MTETSSGYRDYRRAQREQLSKDGIKALEARFAEQEAKVKQAQQDVDKLRVQLNIPDVTASAEGPAPFMTADAARKLESLRIESTAEYDRQATLLAHLKVLRTELGPEGVAQAIPTAVPDALPSSLLEQLSLAEQRLASLSKDFGPEHSEVVKARSQIEDLRSKIKIRIDGILLGLNAKVLSQSNSLDTLTKEVAQAVTNDVAQASHAQPYYEAKRSLEELQRFRQILDMKIATEKVDVALPKSMIVEIVDRAVPSLRPNSPNLPFALALIALGILLDIAGLLTLKGGRRIDLKPSRA